MDEELEAILSDELNRLRGRILGLIESWGLEDRQENGAKQTFKSLSYDAQSNIQSRVLELIDQA